METATQELTIIERSMETIQGGGAILNANATSVANANKAANALLAEIKANGDKLNPELDKKCMELLVKIGKTVKAMNDKRSPITQLLSLIAGEFTGLENQVDPKKPNTPGALIQQHRNKYAQDLANEEKRRNEEAQNKANKNQELINIKAEAEKRLNSYFYNHLAIEKSKLNELFNNTTLETYEGNRVSIMGMEIAYPYTHFLEFKHGMYATRYHTIDEINAILKVHLESFFATLADTYRKEIVQVQHNLLDKLPSKKVELEDIARADASKKEALLKEKERREKEEEERIKLENEQKLNQVQETVETNKLADTTLNLFQQETEMQVKNAAPETRTGYELEVTNAAGWMLIFQFWFTNEGKTLSVEECGKKTLNQMKAFCEKYAHKNSTKIESPFLNYKDTHKAVNRKEK